jgi:glycerate 2-kinase
LATGSRARPARSPAIRRRWPFPSPRRCARATGPCFSSPGGELTVTRTGDGIGGPNAEFCLALAIALKAHPRIHALACDTDGVDGAAEVAGALVGPASLKTAGAAEALARNDAHSWFARAGTQVVTGPTLTNVNDFRAILILPPT